MFFLNQLISAILQLSFILIFFFLCYIFLARKRQSFWQWIGLKKVPIVWSLITLIGAAYLLLSTIPVLWLYQSKQIVLSGFPLESYKASGFSIETIAVILLWAILQTSLTEEILFRGCLRNLFSIFLKPRQANLLQSLLFAALHLPAVISYGLMPSAIVFTMTALVAYVMGWLVSKKSDGSILNTWILHASVNILSQCFILYFLI